MRILVLCAAFGLLFSSGPVWGQPPPLLREGQELVPAVPPVIWRATAAKVNGEVVIQLSYPGVRITDKKDAQGVTVTVAAWEDARPLTFGKEVRAYSGGGRSLSEEAVLKALAELVPVVCFVRSKPDDPKRPDPFYRSVFRDDAVLLVFEEKSLGLR